MKPAFSSPRIRVVPLEADFVVVGGGMAGVCAALAAARNGASVVLIQDRTVLGGNASSEIRMHIVGADCHGRRPGARESGIIEELRLEDSFRNPHRSYSQWDLLLYEKLKTEPRITLLLDTALVACRKKDTLICSVSALRHSTEELFEIKGTIFADCSGDCALGAEAGADFHVGREAREQYGESLAQPTADKQTLGSSILLTGREYSSAQQFHTPSWARRFQKEDLFRRPIQGFEYGYWWFEWGGQLDTIRDNEVIRHELLRIAVGIWDYIKNSGDYPASANWALDWVGMVPGKRESRRLLGPHVLSQSDLQSGQIFPDAVAYGGWAIDLHPPLGVDAKTEPPFTPTHLPHLYTIPLRALFSRNVSNLLFAGRNISATHVAFASTRVMATCSIVGQAIGTAAALAIREGCEMRQLIGAPLMTKVQQMLLRDDAFIPSLYNHDPNDLARAAKVSASDSTEGFEAGLIQDGHTRDLPPEFGSWSDGLIHHWRSLSLPAWVELELPKESEIREIHLTFDSGFQRELTLSLSVSTNRAILRGAQPELVRSYTISVDGCEIVKEMANFLRKRTHKLETPVVARRIRIDVQQTHGVAEARLFEVRLY
ncbi:MAG: FAD-dependent oxidoreductase [Chthoniobacterales bacterium]